MKIRLNRKETISALTCLILLAVIACVWIFNKDSSTAANFLWGNPAADVSEGFFTGSTWVEGTSALGYVAPYYYFTNGVAPIAPPSKSDFIAKMDQLKNSGDTHQVTSFSYLVCALAGKIPGNVSGPRTSSNSYLCSDGGSATNPLPRGGQLYRRTLTVVSRP